MYQSHYIDHDIDVSAVTDFDKIKEKIVCKLINEEANKQFLQDKPYSKLEDLAVVYQILMDKTGEGTATITITDNLMDGYGITLEELHDQALQNMDTLQPHSFKGMNETVAEMIAVDIAREQNVGMDEAKEMAMQMMSDIPDAYHRYGSYRKEYHETERGSRSDCKRPAGYLWICDSSGHLQVAAWNGHAYNR